MGCNAAGTIFGSPQHCWQSLESRAGLLQVDWAITEGNRMLTMKLWVLKLDIVQELKDKPPILATECHVCREPTMMWLGAWARASDLKAAVAASERAGVSIINNLLDVSIAAVTERGVKRVQGTQELELEKALEPLEK